VTLAPKGGADLENTIWTLGRGLFGAKMGPPMEPYNAGEAKIVREGVLAKNTS